jgi:hypothetical protein
VSQGAARVRFGGSGPGCRGAAGGKKQRRGGSVAGRKEKGKAPTGGPELAAREGGEKRVGGRPEEKWAGPRERKERGKGA